MIADPPETAMATLPFGSLDGLSRPIYLACGHEVERRQFLEMHGLAPHEVLRVRHLYQVPSQCPEGKILILAPRWGEDRATAKLVTWWVEDCDRYTYAAELEPVPGDDPETCRFPLARRWSIALAVLSLVAFYVAIVFGRDPFGWLVAAAGWSAAATFKNSDSDLP